MATTARHTRLVRPIRSLLSGLRWRIRAYVWADGLLSALIWLGLMFWISLALDYFPVLVWASELSRPVRLGLLVITGVVLAGILFRRILARTFVGLADRSMAILIERRYPQFRDSLVTTVELSRRSPEESEFDPKLFEETREQAIEQLAIVRLREVFQLRPLVGKFFLAVLLALSIATLYMVNAEVLELGARRLYLLSDVTWPRRARIDVVGVGIERVSPRTGEISISETLPFVDGTIKVARGTNAVLRVRADAHAERVPATCRIYYTMPDGSRGQVNMRSDGLDRDGAYHLFTFAGKPFQAILEDVTFDVVGYDHRVRNFRVQVVETPAVVSTVLHCEFPDYLVDRETGIWLPREVEYRSSGTQLPRGTKVVIRMRSNKDLEQVEFYRPDTKESQVVDISPSEDRRTFEYTIPAIEDSFVLDVSLRDTDSVLTDTPHRVFVTAVEDRPPEVNVFVRGIGSAVTPQVVLPASGEVVDDYGVEQLWFEFAVNGGQAMRQVVPLTKDGKITAGLDFRDMRSANPPLELVAGDRLRVAIKARDRYNLGDSPNIGTAEQLELEVVTPDELLIRLDRRELAERRRFEHILDEMLQMRDSLLRVQSELQGNEEGSALEAALEQEVEIASGEQPGQGINLSALRAQQALRQSEKSREEVLGVAASFRSIRDELVNNRVDAEDRQSRLETRVAVPLETIGNQQFPKLDAKLEALEKAIEAGQDQVAAAEAAINESNLVIAELTSVLDAMLDIESYNELIEIVRTLIDDQQRLLEETKKARKRGALEELLK